MLRSVLLGATATASSAALTGPAAGTPPATTDLHVIGTVTSRTGSSGTFHADVVRLHDRSARWQRVDAGAASVHVPGRDSPRHAGQAEHPGSVVHQLHRHGHQPAHEEPVHRADHEAGGADRRVCDPTPTGPDHDIYKLSKVLVTPVSLGGSGGEDRLTVNYAFNFVALDFLLAGKDVTWDQSKNL